ncbi:MAG: hypothetical protein HQ481_09055 [Alphaproteobacteria bacterium]|nr:hypothetical protein [Alphaproteobacteria bacterium]
MPGGGRTALFIWELGDGLGHVTRLLRIAEVLRQDGMRCLFVVRNVEMAGAVVLDHGFGVLQAPIARIEPIRGPDSNQPVSVADILGSIGFADRRRLEPLVCAWSALIDAVAPDIAITDYAPTANLALYGGPVPVLVIGDGFTLPPVDVDHFLPLRKGRPAHDEGRLAAVVTEVQAARARPAPAHLPLLFAGDQHFVVTLPELDAWSAYRSRQAIGPIAPPLAPASGTPTMSYFAYLSADYPYIDRVLAGLVESGRSGSVFLRDSTATQREAWRGKGLVIHDQPQDLAEVAESTATIIHHGGIGTSEAVLALGRTHLLVPRHFEQFANADRLGRLGVAVALRSGGKFGSSDLGRALEAAEIVQRRSRAATVAATLASRPANALHTAIAACRALLGAQKDRGC